MNKIYALVAGITLFFSLAMQNAIAQTHSVTFNVNTFNTDVDPAGIYLAGGDDFGVPGDNPMSDTDMDGVWTITVEVADNYTGYYIFTNGVCPDWTCKENLFGQDCASPDHYNDRQLVEVQGDLEINTCFGQCTTDGSCPVIDTTPVTFKVDMNNVTDAFMIPEVNATFNGWCGNCNPMTDDDMDGVWETTIDIEAGDHEYKFSADGWGIQEELAGVDGGCTLTTDGFTNRTLTVGADPVILETVCWQSCSACGGMSTSSMVTFQVDMNDVTDAFMVPEVNATFNGWCGNCNPLTDDDMDGVWETTIELEPGDYEYKFSADAWGIEEELGGIDGDCVLTTDGFTNRILTVGSDDMVLDAVCWESCLPCDGMVSSSMVTFQVDMDEVTDAFTTPELNGVFNGWCGNCNAMSDDDMDGVWEVTIELEPGTYEYKFSADSWTIQEELADVPGDCTSVIDGFTNRTLTVGNQDMVLDPVCWMSCNECGVVITSNQVTFQVDMSLVTDAFTTPEVNGTFNGWCGNCDAMTDMGNGIWSTTIELESGTYEYKFSADTWTIQEELAEIDGDCTISTDGFTNRSLEVGSEDMTIDLVCWQSCDPCSNSVTELSKVSYEIYPNPYSEGVVTIESSFGNTIEVYNMNGKKVRSLELTDGVAKADLSNLDSGVYFIKSNLGIKMSKLIVQ